MKKLKIRTRKMKEEALRKDKMKEKGKKGN